MTEHDDNSPDDRPPESREEIAARTAPSDVGYKRPPKETRFKKGVSGNPNGRPKGRRTTHAFMKKYGERTLWVGEQGKSKLRTWDQIVVRKLAALALQGHAGARKLWLALVGPIEAKDYPEPILSSVVRIPKDVENRVGDQMYREQVRKKLNAGQTPT